MSKIPKKDYEGNSYNNVWQRQESILISYIVQDAGYDQMPGVPTTLVRSGEQWDLPNVWPPLEHMVIMGLYNSGQEEAVQEARRLARHRVDTCYKIYSETGHMFEKVTFII